MSAFTGDDWKRKLPGLTLPLLLEGDMAGALGAFGPGPGVCPEEWLLQNPGLLLNVLAAYREAGADVLPSMTFGANVLALSAYEMGEECGRLNTRLTELTAAGAGDAAVAGGMSSTGHLPEPFGPLPYADLIDTYAGQALTLTAAGAKLLLLEGMPSLWEARAAVLGARPSSLPILVSLAVGDDGRTLCGGDPLAAMVCLQELGISAFGLCCPDGPEALVEPLRRLAPHAKVPLMARPGMRDTPPENVSRSCWELLAAGAVILGGGPGSTPGHMRAMRILLNQFDYEAFPPPGPSQDPAVLLCDESAVYFLDGELSCSKPILCGEDLSAAIPSAESDRPDVLLFHLRNTDDAHVLGQRIHLAHTPACFLSETEEALELALLYYGGRALVSSRSGIERHSMELLAASYGALIL